MSSTQRPFSSFRLLTFDIYGTLIDWESGVREALSPITTRLPSDHALKNDWMALGNAFGRFEKKAQSLYPSLAYPKVLASAYRDLARELLPETFPNNDDPVLREESETFGESVGRWPAFPDTVDAIRRLKRKGYKLIPLSNVDHASFKKTLTGPLSGAVESGEDPSTFFDAVYTAQDIGSYKPDPRNFDYLISHIKSDFGVSKEEILHVAQSLFHDHEPAKKVGLESVWIARGEGGKSGMGGNLEEFVKQGKVGFGWRFSTLGEFADAVEKEG